MRAVANQSGNQVTILEYQARVRLLKKRATVLGNDGDDGGLYDEFGFVCFFSSL